MKRQRSILFLTGIAVLLLACGRATAADPNDLLAIQAGMEQGINDHDWDVFLGHMVDDIVWDLTVLPVPLQGKAEARALLDEVVVAFPDWATMDGVVLANNDFVVANHATIGTHLGVYNGIPASGGRDPWPHLDLYEFEDGVITHFTTYGDMSMTITFMGAIAFPPFPDWTPSFTLPAPQPTGMSALAAVQAAQALWNAGDLAGYASMQHADDDILIAALGGSFTRSEYAATQEMYFSAFSNLQINPVRYLDMRDGWILCECTWTGTHTNWFLGVPPSGKEVEWRGAILYQYDEQGLERTMHVHFDQLALMNQIAPVAPEFPVIPEAYVQDEITSASLTGNPLGDPATRPLLVHLPPSYESSPDRHYPTIYLLHGFLGDHTYFTSAGVFNVFAEALTGFSLGADVDSVVQQLIASGQMGEAIIVMPNALNSFGGSFYESSPLIGNYREYIATELVAYVDANYRTIADPNNRAIAGHSMGGYGAISLAMEYPQVFGAVAAMSPAVGEVEATWIDQFTAGYPFVMPIPFMAATTDDLWSIFLQKPVVNMGYSLAAAWTPNFTNPPFYVDLPVEYPAMTAVPAVLDIWMDSDLVSQIGRDGGNLSGKPLFVDEAVGPPMLMAEVPGIGSILSALHDQGISYTYDAFDGDHLTHLRYQLASALTFLYPHIAPCDSQGIGDMNNDCRIDCTDFAIMASHWLEDVTQ